MLPGGPTVPGTAADLVSTVIGHLENLETLALYSASEAKMRVATASLRLLLCDGLLANAWRASGIGGPMTFKVWCIRSTSQRDVFAFCGGGDMLPKIGVSMCFNARLEQKHLNLGDFCRQSRIQVGTDKISTVEVIEYVANALGGVHFDPGGRAARKPKGEILRRIEAGEISGLGIRLNINKRSLLHHEVLSIAQAVVRSPEVTQLRDWRAADR